MKIKIIGVFEIFLIVLSGVAFAHIMGKTNSLTENIIVKEESKFIKFLRQKALNYLSNGLVSAQSSSIQTCLLDNSGSYCQEYPSQICDSQCSSSCFPGRRVDFSSCQLGTCFDPNLGLCNSGVPKANCENNGGVWDVGVPAECTRKCCLIGPDGSGGANQARLATARECINLEQTTGIPTQWDTQTSDELSCLAKVRNQNEGACVLEFLPEFNKYDCKFITQSACAARGGTFYVNQLCTNPQLNTKCERTENTKCFDGKDGVYFVDSCGNRANIYDYDKRNNLAGYWTSVVPLTQSCALSSSSNSFANQQKCGNCDYIRGSICGTPSSLDKAPGIGNLVCRNLDCKDRNNQIRKHGESWCVFDGQIGLEGQNGTNEERGVDVPGSRHYRELCFNGEIRLEPCAEYRNGVCVEQNINPSFTNAQCRMNTGVLCTSYNENEDKLAKCEESPDCFLKHVEIDRFKFDVCVPKYPQGLELDDSPGEDSVAICAAASQTCTYYEKKGLDGRWSCKINCGCKDAIFTETMNNLCMSLGDCGTQVNLAKEVGKGHSIGGDKFSDISLGYIEALKRLATPKAGQRVDGLTNAQIGNLFGSDFDDPSDITKLLAGVGLGASGAIVYAGLANYGATTLMTSGALGGALNGALIGAGIGYIIGLALGLEGDKLVNAVIVGAVLGALAVYSGAYSAAATWAFGAASVPVVGWIIAIVIVVVIAILQIAGVGEYRERKVEFTCLPWQPPAGGADCDKCNKLGAGECSAYKCASLGKTCEFINPNTEDEACVNIAPNDASAPQISFNRTSLPNGFSYEESTNGVRIKKDSATDGCLAEYSPIVFDILTNEPGQCKISETRPDNGYNEMPDTFFDSSTNRYVLNHVESTAMPTLDSLGISGPDPSRRGNYDLYVLCQDRSGNAGDNAYNIRFCVAPANDVQRPRITKFVPESPGVVGISSTSYNLAFFTDEPATCRFSTVDQPYELMENEANCQNGLSQSTTEGWICLARLNVTQNENDYYFRCADQPWLGINITQSSYALGAGRNVATESDRYVVTRTSTPLTITSVSPNNRTITSATSPVSVNLDVVTAGGIDSGKAFCKYSFNGQQYVNFFTTSLSNHRQIFSSLFAGQYNIRINCTDRAGNSAEGNSEFRVEVDNTGPIITRVYNSGTSLTVITNEASTCEYSLNSCSFDFGNGTALIGATKTHSMPYQNGLTYNIKCRDGFGNVGNCLRVTGGY